MPEKIIHSNPGQRGLLLAFFLCAALVTLAPVPVLAQEASAANLTISVTGPEQQPIEGAVLFVNDQHESEQVTGPDGIAVYTLEAGSYLLYSYVSDYLDRILHIHTEGEDKEISITHQPAISWSTDPPNAPIGIGEANGVRLATAGGKLYLRVAYGGPAGGTQYGALHDFYVYDPAADNWTQLPDAPYAGLYGITTAYGPTAGGSDAIYIMRGYPAGQRTWMARYNIDDATWESDLNHQIPWRYDLGSPYSGEGFQDYPRNGAVMVWDKNDHIYLFPGSAYSYEKYDWYRYSVSEDSWEDMEALPHRQGPGNAAVLVEAGGSGLEQDYLYVQFGLSPAGNYTSAEFWRYGLADGQWENMADHAYGADDGSMLAWDGGNYIYHTPGAYVEQSWDRGQDQKRELMRYDISQNHWVEMEKAPYNRWGGWDDAGGIVIIENNIYGMKGGSDVAWAEDDYVSGGGDIPSDKLWRFTIPEETHTLSVLEAAGEGHHYPTPGAYAHSTGSHVELLAIPEEGWVFSEWLLDGTSHSGDAALTLQLTGDMSVQAVFMPETFILYASPPVLYNLNYPLGHGPSQAASFTLWGEDLEPGSGQINVSGTAHYEVSADGENFQDEIQLSYADASLEPTPLFVRLKAGLDAGSYANESIQIEGGGDAIEVVVHGEVSSTSPPYTQDFNAFQSLATLPAGWSLDGNYEYRGDFGEGTGGGLRGNGVLGFQVTATPPNNQFTASLSLVNDSGSPITDLLIAYRGRTARNVTGTPEWVVSLEGQEQEDLGYSTAEGVDKDLVALVSGLQIEDEASFGISWYTTSDGTTGHRRQIGATNIFVDKAIPIYADTDMTSLPPNATIAIKDFVQLEEDLVVENLLITRENALHLMPGVHLSVNGSIFNLNEGDTASEGLLLQSGPEGTASLIHHSPGTVATIQRYIEGQNTGKQTAESSWNWHLISSPVESQAIDQDWLSGEHGDPYGFFFWDEDDQEWNELDDEGEEMQLFIPGRGYRISYPSEATLDFEGPVNVLDVEDIMMVKSSGESLGWNLLGNPFASALRWNDAHWELEPDVGGVAKTWDKQDRSYRDILGGEAIPAMNGFFVYYEDQDQSPRQLVIPSASRTHDPTPWYKEHGGPLFRLAVRDREEHGVQNVILRFMTAATPGFDLAYDALFKAGHAPQLYFMDNGLRYSTRSLPDFNEELVLKLGFVKKPATLYQLELREDVPGHLTYVYDRVLARDHALSADKPYEFTASPGDPEHRFDLRFVSDGLTVWETDAKDPVRLFVSEGVLHIELSREQTDSRLQIFDTSGRKLVDRTLGNILRHQESLGLPTGIYIVRFTSQEHNHHQRILLP